MTDDQIIARGNACEVLMRDPTLCALSDEFEAQTVAAMLQTAPHETKKREGLYATIQGKRDFVSLMHHYVTARDELIQSLKDADEADQAI